MSAGLQTAFTLTFIKDAGKSWEFLQTLKEKYLCLVKYVMSHCMVNQGSYFR
jgi:hypothetical protein